MGMPPANGVTHQGSFDNSSVHPHFHFRKNSSRMRRPRQTKSLVSVTLNLSTQGSHLKIDLYVMTIFGKHITWQYNLSWR